MWKIKATPFRCYSESERKGFNLFHSEDAYGKIKQSIGAVVSPFCAAATALGVAHARVSLLVKDMHLLLNPRIPIRNTPLKTNMH